MQKKQVSIIPKGIKTDLAVEQFPADFAQNILNMRITTTGEDTSLCLVNERGNQKVADFDGKILGYAQIDEDVYVFTLEGNLYKVFIEDSNVQISLVATNITNLDKDHPIECITSIESDKVKKIYWADGKNEVRYINVVSDTILTGPYEFVRNDLKLEETITVEKLIGGGYFNSGIIQYAISYYNYYSNETPIINASTINYISLNQGSKADDQVACSFRITVKNLDNRFEYIRVYAIKRTSLDGTPEVYRVNDIYIKDKTEVTITDNGTIGASEDPTLLLYLGGDKIIASTLNSQDGNTLFLADVKDNNNYIEEPERLTIQETCKDSLQFIPRELICETNFLEYKGLLNNSQDKIATFKYGENYRIGVQYQFNDGKVSDVVYLKDIQNNVHPNVLDNGIQISELKAQVTFPDNAVRARLMYVPPSLYDRTRVCQGIISPTLYEEGARASEYLYAMPSWILRDSSYKNNQIILNEVQSIVETEPTTVNSIEQIRGNKKSCVIKYYFIKNFLYGQSNISSYFKFSIDSKEYSFGGSGSPQYIDENLTKYYERAVEKLKELCGNDVQYPSKEEWIATKDNGTIVINYVLTIPFEQAIYQNLLTSSSSNNILVDTSICTFYSPEIENIHSSLIDKKLQVSLLGGIFIQDYYSNYTILTSNTLRDINQIGIVNQKFKETFTSGLLWNDVTPDTDLARKEEDVTNYYPWIFRTYLWHREGSLNADKINNNNSYNNKYPDAYSVLQKKIFLNVRSCTYANYFNNPIEVQADYKIHIKDYEGAYKLNNKIYQGTIDLVNVNTSDKGYPIMGVKVRPEVGVYEALSREDQIVANTLEEEKEIYSKDPVSIKYKTADHIVLDLNKYLPNTKKENSLLIPQGMVNSDLLVDCITDKKSLNGISIEDAEKLGLYVGFKFITITKEASVINGNVQKIISLTKQEESYQVVCVTTQDSPFPNYETQIGKSISIGALMEYVDGNISYGGTYKITLVDITSDEETSTPYILVIDIEHLQYIDKPELVSEEDINPNNKKFFYIVDIIKNLSRQYGGKLTNNNGDLLLQTTRWIPIGDFITKDNDGTATLFGKYGDTYFQRYDCLNTKPYSKEDKNQCIDITSFFVETRINIDGRYDTRGDTSVNINYNDYNSINDVYTQQDNYFVHTNATIKDPMTYFPNGIVFSKTKTPTEINDSWTNISMSNITFVNGQYGKINSLNVFNNNIYFFQNKAIGVINYNQRVQVSTSDGIPIELANGNKVQGTTYLTNNYGCINKWSICETPSGLYFIDDWHKAIMHFNGQQFNDLSYSKQLYSWIHKHVSSSPWKLGNYEVKTLYDKYNKDVYFTSIDGTLAFNENLGEFSSMYSYSKVSWLFNIKGASYQVYNKTFDTKDSLWKLHGNSEYSKFFDEYYPYSVTIVANPEFQQDKIFDTLEFRTNGTEVFNNNSTSEYPFNTLVTSNEYQTAISSTNNIKKKFRIWRWQVGRDFKNKKDRIRNPWSKMTITGNSKNQVRLYDLAVSYYV